MTSVVAAVIERLGRTLICRRRAGQSHPLQWEFPGGKVEPGETPFAALVRELEEELAIRISSAEEIERYEYRYPGGQPILLIFFRVTEFQGELENRVFHEIRWEPRSKLPEFDFLEGDRDFLARLAG